MKNKKNKTNEVAVVDKELNKRSLAALATIVSDVMPANAAKKLKKLTRPTLVKPSIIPIGGRVSGEILGVHDSISHRADMKDAKLLLLRNKNNPENPIDFLLPLTGVIKSAVGGIEGAKQLVGQTLHVIRNPDGETTKYGGKNDAPKKVYMFDIYVEE